jgi:ribosome-associated protein
MVSTSRKLAIALAKLADKKKAKDILVLQVKKLIFITDYFLIASGTNKKQTQAIADDIMFQAKHTLNANLLSKQGYEEGTWIVLDLGDVIIHIMHENLRGFYELELLWGDAPQVKWHK